MKWDPDAELEALAHGPSEPVPFWEKLLMIVVPTCFCLIAGWGANAWFGGGIFIGYLVAAVMFMSLGAVKDDRAK